MSTAYLFCEQVGIMTWKNLHQKRLAGRTTLKEILTPLGLIGMWIYIMIMASMPMSYPDAVYVTRDLPPLSSRGRWGIFRSPEDEGNGNRIPEVINSKRLYYSPNSHDGVNYLVSDTFLNYQLFSLFNMSPVCPSSQMGNFSQKYPQVKVLGFASPADVSDQYTRNIFDTWSAVTFDLSADQVSSQRLVVNQENQSVVNYKIRVSPNEMYLADTTVDEDVYRDAITDADQWANSGYFTIQNFIGTYTALLYDNVDPSFTVSGRRTFDLHCSLNMCDPHCRRQPPSIRCRITRL